MELIVLTFAECRRLSDERVFERERKQHLISFSFLFVYNFHCDYSHFESA